MATAVGLWSWKNHSSENRRRKLSTRAEENPENAMEISTDVNLVKPRYHRYQHRAMPTAPMDDTDIPKMSTRTPAIREARILNKLPNV